MRNIGLVPIASLPRQWFWTTAPRVDLAKEMLSAFAATLLPSDHVVVEATGNATAVVEILAPKVARVVVANPVQAHLLARARTRTERIDARILAQLYAAGFPPEVWIPAADTQVRRRQVTRRNQRVKGRVRLKAALIPDSSSS